MTGKKIGHVLLGASICLIALWLSYLFSSIPSSSSGHIYWLKPATSRQTFVKQLSDQGIITHPSFFSFYVLLHHQDQLKAGEYYFKRDITPYQIWKQVSTGSGWYYRSFTIVPGWTYQQLRTALSAASALKQTQFIWPSDNLSLEGQFYPDTYLYTRDSTDLALLKRAYARMQAKMNDAWQHRAANLPYTTPYQALIVASMIEKEGYWDKERPLIAGVILNRLKKKMLLQIDATVIYGLGARYTGTLSKADLLMETPYNTYLHTGLPPTPIAIPGAASIDAALHPLDTPNYYYVAKSDGSHTFSETLEAHHDAVAQIATVKHGKVNEVLLLHYITTYFKKL